MNRLDNICYLYCTQEQVSVLRLLFMNAPKMGAEAYKIIINYLVIQMNFKKLNCTVGYEIIDEVNKMAAKGKNNELK